MQLKEISSGTEPHIDVGVEHDFQTNHLGEGLGLAPNAA